MYHGSTLNLMRKKLMLKARVVEVLLRQVSSNIVPAAAARGEVLIPS